MTTQQLLPLATRQPAQDLRPPLEEVLPPLEIAHSVRPPLEIVHWCFLAVELHANFCVFLFVLVPFVLHFRLDLSPGIVLSVLLVVVSKAHAVYGAVYWAVAGYVNLI